ncbi:recombinase family protein [Pseudomonas chlororaphis]|uniref:Phage recombinase n=1 Tax=Pseudomonas chlororaphis TaxID=587753 RepID=A0AAX3G627_9PSED|nr:recombinase family protein [Pseudomonas chlororaphis]AZC37077.1 phage recombinase, putative [Pseudomonas chlororaphis subsp. piscium]AZC43623.1 phage recombinase, putative [Pseudomonas chlororaphis subsp. piscium]WDG75486.1 recombinase family protein [Pseudomonas chlororaphis]WDH26878.1 recombinase family protein [Pseudomonas chlororaphis]WDH74006.1 recombinase family protein [Pseudomonas chlororaphis]
MPTNGAKVYSYTRFSDPKQALGHSADRQLQYAKAWAAERGLMLDETLSLKDEGLSAFHQRHIKQGALGVFLLAVDEGRIPSGSVLIVEGLDRLSRAEPIQAQAQLAQIINAGITVVTASDGREYNREKLKAQPMDLVYSLLVMIRAHEESDTKSKRVKAAIRRQCEGWMAGTYRGLIRNGSDPNWVRWTGTEWELIPERVEAVMFALARYKEGLGADRTHQLMVENGYSLNCLGLNSQQLYRLVKLSGLKGAKRISVDGEDYELPEYYPRLMSDIEFDELQVLTKQRSRRRPKGAIPGVITGIGMTWCGYCGTAMTGANQMRRIKSDGKLLDGHRRLICVSNLNAMGCKAGSISVAPVERALMAYCSDQINLQRLQEPAHDGQDLRSHLTDRRKVVDDLERQLFRVTEALLASENDGATPMVFVRKARDLEEQLQLAKVQVRQAERELASSALRQSPADARIWADLAEGVNAQDVGVREKVRQLVMDTFERIVIYIRGIVPEGRKYIDVLLIAKSGQRRWMRIERRSGVWTAGSDRPR